MYYLVEWKTPEDNWLIICEGKEQKSTKIVKVFRDLKNGIPLNRLFVDQNYTIWEGSSLDTILFQSEDLDKVMEQAILEAL